MRGTASSTAIETATYWFVKLERAVEDGDFRAALQAQEQLKRLGVTVHFTRPDRQEVTGAHG